MQEFRARWFRAITIEKIILGGLGLMILTTAIIILRGLLGGARVVGTFPMDDGEVGAYGRIGITFNQAMNTREVEERIKITPEVPGSFIWEGNTVWFNPQVAWQAGVTYQFQLLAGAAALDGRKLPRVTTNRFSIRQPEILYLSTEENRLELWRISVSGGTPQRLSAGGVDVYDFAPARDGEQVTYSVKNTSGGMDLWLVRRDGSQNHRLIDCTQDLCSQPAWSPDGRHIVYHREVRQRGSEATTGVWTVEAKSGQTDYIFPGSNPSFSPDGAQLVMVNSEARLIRVLNTKTGKGIELQEAAGAAPTWFPDSSKLIYASLQISGEQTYLALFQANPGTKHVARMLSGAFPDMDLNLPAITPDGKHLLIGMRAIGGVSAQQLWMMDIDGSHAQEITRDPTYNNASYSWDPWGTRVVFQQSKLGESKPVPQIITWNRMTGKTTLVADHATLPEWLP